jgi:outer membrane biogenesis lipoprotein LolB
MIPRRPASFLLSLLGLMVLSLTACSTLQSISILPAAGTETLTAAGQTAQYTAYGTSQMGNAIPTTTNISGSVTWTSSNTAVATITASGLATAVGSGTAEITAVSNGVVATSNITVTLPSSGTGSPGVPSITVTPGSGTDTFIGETAQFEATGSLTGTSGTQNLTTQVQWISSNAQVATVNSSGLTTAVGAGTTTIIAQSGGINGSATLTVSFIGETTQFIALGNLAGSAATQNLTNNVAWVSSDTSIATIDQNGLATAVSANTTGGTTTITAIGTTSTGSLITATATFAVSATVGTGGLPTLAVYEVGPGTGTVTSSPLPIVCGTPGGSCTGNFSKGTVVTLTETPGSSSVFGGWSSNCTTVTATTCTITMSNNETVGAIFNP